MQEVRVKVTRLFKELLNSKETVVINVGGARSGKSFATMQYLIYKLLSEQDRFILITRKTFPSLRVSVILPFLEMLGNLGIRYLYNKSEHLLAVNNNLLLFSSLDNPEKIKSTEFNYIWMEEANEFTYEDYQLLKMRLSRQTNTKNQIILTFNPVECYISERVMVEEKDIKIIRSNYKDNPFLSQEYKRLLEDLKHQNQTLYKIYALGEFATPEGLVYDNFEIIYSYEITEKDKVIWGLDFGYNDPTALVKLAVNTDTKQIIILDEFYQTHLTTPEIVDIVKSKVAPNELVVCDSAEPDRIKELQLAGVWAVPCLKTRVTEEINYIKTFKIKVLNYCQNTIKELKSYTWKEKNGRWLDEPVDFANHALDAMRYAVTYLTKSSGFYFVVK
jgi:phage terminase large subunit